MGLNIKNERTHALVRRLAEVTGQSQTSAVEDAVRRRLDEALDADGLAAAERSSREQDVNRLLAEFRGALTDDDKERMGRTASELYDDAGLPR
ncbi:type II toxin-antitoxin system VapB family antitoxin [Sediminihabitans luteus]|nr:type II toxin-antitoxin system VapB family antitoxin [Sediminihabitans luteus]